MKRIPACMTVLAVCFLCAGDASATSQASRRTGLVEITRSVKGRSTPQVGSAHTKLAAMPASGLNTTANDAAETLLRLILRPPNSNSPLIRRETASVPKRTARFKKKPAFFSVNGAYFAFFRTQSGR